MAKDYFTQLPTGLLALPATKALTAAMISCLMEFLFEYRRNDPQIQMSAARLAKLANCSRATAQTAINKLITVGYITRQSIRSFKGDSTSNVYTVNTQPIEPLETAPRRGYDAYGDAGLIYAQQFPNGEWKAKHFRFRHAWRRLPAWRTLSPAARCILWHMHSLYNPTEFVFKYSINAAKSAGKCNHQQAKLALAELMTKGWVTIDEDRLHYLQSFGDGTPSSKKKSFTKWKG